MFSANPNTTQTLSKVTSNTAQVTYTPAQDTAHALFSLGLNVFPVPYARKGGWPWRQFQCARAHPKALDALFAGPCNLAVMTGRTSANLFVLDCETPASFTEQGQRLRAAGIPLWAVRSGGGGGHYYLRCAEGEVANIPSSHLPAMEVRGNRCYVLAPPSVHPETGEVYQWEKQDGHEPPTVRLTDLDWLPLQLAHRTPARPQPSASPYPDLSARTRDFILNGARVGERNNRLFAAACDMAGNDYDQDDIHRTLLPVAVQCGLSEQEATTAIRSALSRPRAPARQHQTKANPWGRAIAWAAQRAWPGRTGQTDRAVFLACCQRAQVASNQQGIFRASTREVAELARVSHKTAATSLTRLQRASFIERAGYDRASRARLWKLSEITLQTTTWEARTDYTIPPWQSSSVVITRSDAAEWRALGKTASVVYEGLLGCAEAVMPKRLAERLKLSRHQVQRALQKLRAYDLARRESQGWVGVARSAEWLDEHVARPAGTLGKGEERRRKHAEQRAWRASRMVLRARFGDVSRAAAVLAALGVWEGRVVPAVSVRYCANCGQGVFVFAGSDPPAVCAYCADQYGRKEGSVWLAHPPAQPLKRGRRRKRKRR